MESCAVVAEGMAGACRFALSVERAWVPWHGQVDGKLTLRGTDRPQRLLSYSVSLLAPAPGSEGLSAVGGRDWSARTIEAGETVELDFSFRLGWGVSLGASAVARAVVIPSAFIVAWPQSVSIPVEVTPPAEFVRVATEVARISGFDLGLWNVIMAGDGAAISLRPKQEAPLTEIHLRLFRSHERDYGDLLLHSRGGRTRKIPLRLPREDFEEARRVLVRALEPVLAATEALPIPSQGGPQAGDLPLPAARGELDATGLPRPSGCPREEK